MATVTVTGVTVVVGGAGLLKSWTAAVRSSAAEVGGNSDESV